MSLHIARTHMSGHSKWANIKRKKEANDKVKGAEFSKLSRYISLAVSEGGGLTDPEHNVHLRLAIEKAKESNMPKENIARAIERGSGPDSQLMKEVRYEGFGPGGTALLVLAATDNANRTVASVKNTIERNGGKMGSLGSVSYLFEHCVHIVFDRKNNSEDDVFAFADAMSVLNIEEDEDIIDVYVPFEDLGKIAQHLGALHPESTEVEYRPLSYIEISEKESEQAVSLIEALEDLDDIQAVFTNAQFNLPT